MHENDVAELLCGLHPLERSGIVRDRELPVDDPKVRKPDLTVARAVLQWEPKVPLQEGLEHTIAYFRQVVG